MTPYGSLILYLSYGEGLHVAENVYSITTLFRFLAPDDGRCSVIVYTDDPDPFRGLPVAIRQLDPATLSHWAGPYGYKHRRKTMCIADALERYRRPLMFVDGDTWFRRHPRSILDRLEPGLAFLHLRERRLSLDPAWSDWRSTADVPTDAAMWNSGVVAIHPANASAIATALESIDRFGAEAARRPTVEQLATGLALGRATALGEACGTVFHYWPPRLRRPARARLPALLRDVANLPLSERAERLYAERPGRTVKAMATGYRYALRRLLMFDHRRPRTSL